MLSLDITNLVLIIINLIVLYLILRHFLFRPVLGIMEKRNALIEGQLSDASEAGKKAEALKAQYEEKLKASRLEADKIVEKARRDARLEYDKMVEDANGQAGKILENAKKTAQAEQEKALRETKAEIAGLAITAAAKVIGSRNSEAGDLAVYEKFLAEMGDDNDTDRS